MRLGSFESGRFEPTVVGAVRGSWPTMIVVILISTLAAVSYSLLAPKSYRADATIAVPRTSMLTETSSSDQYLESQVLLIKSQDVADRAARIANSALGRAVLSATDFSDPSGSLKITPPEGSSSGGYGSGIVTVAFTWPDAIVAQTGANAVLQAFDDARVAAITAQGKATVGGIEKAIDDARTRGQRTELVNQRTQALLDQQLDLSHHPTVVQAIEPPASVDGDWKRFAAIGLVVGAVLGAALAYLRAIRRPRLDDRFAPTAIYGAPLIAEIPYDQQWTRAPAEPLPVVASPESARSEAFRLAARYVDRIRAARGGQLAVVFVAVRGGGTSSSLVANLALATAEAGISVLAIDADSSEGALTDLLLAGRPRAEGLDQVLVGARSVFECVEPSPLNPQLSVLGCGHRTGARGAWHSAAAEEVIGKAKASYDLVLVDSPPLPRLVDATDLVNTSDAVIVAAEPRELVRDHTSLDAQLDLVDPEVVGYIYQQTSRRPWVGRQLDSRPNARRIMAEEEPSW